MEWLKDFVSNVNGWQMSGMITVLISIVGAILKSTKMMDKLQVLFEKWTDAAEKPGVNLGVLITTKATAKLGKIYELFIEPVLVLVFQFIPGIIFKFFNGVCTGLRSDNKDFKK